MRVLVVEDDEGIGEGVTIWLTDAGHEAEWTDGALAARLAAETLPDVILLDYQMPDPDGPAVAAALRADPATEHIPIVLMTGLTGAQRKAQEVGAVGCLCKPFDLDDLDRALGEAVGSRT